MRRGYITNSKGQIIAKAELPGSDIKLEPGYEFILVADKAALDTVEVFRPPVVVDETEILIQKQIRESAIAALKTNGKLTADFVDKKI